jgi:hypothetical protein
MAMTDISRLSMAQTFRHLENPDLRRTSGGWSKWVMFRSHGAAVRRIRRFNLV